MDKTSCEVFGHSYHEVTGVCHYCPDSLVAAPKPTPTLPEVIKVNLRTIDGYSESRRFKTLKGARAYAAKKLGTSYDIGLSYAVDMYGVVKLSANIPLTTLMETK